MPFLPAHMSALSSAGLGVPTLLVDPLLLDGRPSLLDRPLRSDGVLGGQTLHGDLIALVPLVRLFLQDLPVHVMKLIVLPSQRPAIPP